MQQQNESARAQCLRIGKRYIRLCRLAEIKSNEDETSVAVALSGVAHRLDLDRLESSTTDDFAHDVGGILRRVHPVTGRLDGHWRPRCVR